MTSRAICCIDQSPAPPEPESASRIRVLVIHYVIDGPNHCFPFSESENPIVFSPILSARGYNGGTSHLLSPSSPARSAMRYPILPAGAFLAAFLVLIPACWHWRTRNVPTLSLIVWLFTLNVVYGANSLVWSDNVRDKAPVWCDICECTVSRATGHVLKHRSPPQPPNSSLELQQRCQRARSVYASTSPWSEESGRLGWITATAGESPCLTSVSVGGFP